MKKGREEEEGLGLSSSAACGKKKWYSGKGRGGGKRNMGRRDTG